MKCAACGYEYLKKTKTFDKVIRYQSGKRKGEIKSVEEEYIDNRSDLVSEVLL